MKHDLIKTGDPDATSHIYDRNGEVVLAYCRRCKRGEGELGTTCVDPPSVECPTCHAWVGWACTGSGYGYHAAGYHPSRVTEAIRKSDAARTT